MIAKSNYNVFFYHKKTIFYIIPQLSNNRNFVFYFAPVYQNLTFFFFLSHHTTLDVLVQNNSIHTLEIPYKFKLGLVFKIFYENCFYTNLSSKHIATSSF